MNCGMMNGILAMAGGLYLVDAVFTTQEIVMSSSPLIMFAIKGIASFYVYKMFHCTSGTINRNPLSNMSFANLLMGGVIGGVILAITNAIIPGIGTGFLNTFLRYVIDAWVLTFVFSNYTPNDMN